MGISRFIVDDVSEILSVDIYSRCTTICSGRLLFVMSSLWSFINGCIKIYSGCIFSDVLFVEFYNWCAMISSGRLFCDVLFVEIYIIGVSRYIVDFFLVYSAEFYNIWVYDHDLQWMPFF